MSECLRDKDAIARFDANGKGLNGSLTEKLIIMSEVVSEKIVNCCYLFIHASCIEFDFVFILLEFEPIKNRQLNMQSSLFTSEIYLPSIYFFQKRLNFHTGKKGTIVYCLFNS